MEINVTLPFDQLHDAEFLHMHAVQQIGAAVERAGFSGCNVTDHPCPSGKWLDAGGHHAQDPFVMLSLVAAVTRSVRLQTGILVLPYRNPFITARAVATLDVFSGGRVSVGVGVGYLKSEYFALGVDFERRNALADEYIRALKSAWTQDEFSFTGSGYEARGARILPRPLQTPHPPLLIGGNSKLAIRRAANLGDAWYPFFTQPGVAATSRTAPLVDDADLTGAIRYLHDYCATIGRSSAPQVRVGSVASVGRSFEAQPVLDRLGALAALGVSGAAVHIAASTPSEWCGHAARFGESVLAKLD